MIINQSCLSSGWEPGLRVSDNSVALVLETNPTDCHKGRMMTQKGGRKAAGEGGGTSMSERWLHPGEVTVAVLEHR